MSTIDLFIDNVYVSAVSAERFEDINPVNGEVVGRVALAGPQDVDRAVQAARRALKGPWGRMSTTERCALLDRVADGIMANSKAFMAAEIADTGKPYALASRIDIPRGAANFRIFANILRAHGSGAYLTDTADGAGAVNYSVREPVGVVGVICPWNLPLLLMTWKVAPALAVGNAVVVKPSEETPATAALLGEVMREAGVPAGVYNVVHGFGADSAGEALTKHPDVQAITFTGETGTGRTIMQTAASGMRKVSFELGGKNPSIVFADANLEDALAGTTRSVFANCGQVCLCSERVYVHRSLFDPFVEGLKQRAEALVLGDPYHADTTMGPLISQQHRAKVLRYMDIAQEEGATLITGGGVPQMDEPFEAGSFIQPTIWTGLPEDARVVKEEIFGPVCHIQPFDDEDEAVAMANDSDYGLCAALWTRDVSRAHRVARKVEAGLVWVNDWFLRDLRTPFGGVKLSGLGREGGTHSLDFYSELKNICIKL